MITGPNMVLFIGLNKSNTDRLHNNQPIWFKLSELDSRLPGELAILIVGDETDDDVQDNLYSLAHAASDGE